MTVQRQVRGQKKIGRDNEKSLDAALFKKVHNPMSEEYKDIKVKDAMKKLLKSSEYFIILP